MWIDFRKVHIQKPRFSQKDGEIYETDEANKYGRMGFRYAGEKDLHIESVSSFSYE